LKQGVWRSGEIERRLFDSVQEDAPVAREIGSGEGASVLDVSLELQLLGLIGSYRRKHIAVGLRVPSYVPHAGAIVSNERAIDGVKCGLADSISFDHLPELTPIYQGDNSSYKNSRDLNKKIPVLFPWFFTFFGFGLYSYSLWQVKPGANHWALWWGGFFLGIIAFMYGIYGILQWVFGGF
jgi:hypothetical protein